MRHSGYQPIPTLAMLEWPENPTCRNLGQRHPIPSGDTTQEATRGNSLHATRRVQRIASCNCHVNQLGARLTKRSYIYELKDLVNSCETIIQCQQIYENLQATLQYTSLYSIISLCWADIWINWTFTSVNLCCTQILISPHKNVPILFGGQWIISSMFLIEN